MLSFPCLEQKSYSLSARESYGKGGLLLIGERELDVVEAHEVLDQLLVQILLRI